ncbi:MAG: SIS domain-containing protein [Chloroflexota bacterium]
MTNGSAETSSSVASGYLDALGGAVNMVPRDALDQVLEVLLRARSLRRRVFVMGNGGSAATASHMVADLMKTAHVAGFDPIRAYSLTDNVPLFTAWSNDESYSVSFVGQIQAHVDPEDVVIAISASGNSPNIVEGLKEARMRGATTIGLLGFDGGRALSLVDIAVHIPCYHYGLVEDLHLAIGHALTAGIRVNLEGRSAQMAHDKSYLDGSAVDLIMALPEADASIAVVD